MRTMAIGLAILLLATGCSAGSSWKQAPPAWPGPSQHAEPAPAHACTPSATAAYLNPKRLGSGIESKAPPIDGTPEHPWFISLAAAQMERDGGGLSGETYAVRSGTAMIGPEATRLYATLEPPPTPDWFAEHVAIEGLTIMEGEWPQVRIPDGSPGESFRVTFREVLQSDGSIGDIAITFCRREPPTASLSYRHQEGWRPVEGDGYIPGEGPLTLRITFTEEIDPETAELALLHLTSAGQAIDDHTWVDRRTLDLTISEPGPVLPLHLRGARDVYGQYVVGGLPTVYPGDPAHLVAIDVSREQKQRLTNLPPLIEGVDLSPDGSRLLLWSPQPRAGYPAFETPWLFDIPTGRREALDTQPYRQWVTSGDLVHLRSEEGRVIISRLTADGRRERVLDGLPEHESIGLAPNGERLYLLVPADHAPVRESYRPYRLLVASTTGPEHRLLEGSIELYRPDKGGLRLYDPVWSPDSTRLAVTQTTADGTVLVIIDAESGKTRTVARDLPQWMGHNRDRILWSPDGRHLLVGSALIDLETGEALTLEGVAGTSPWSHDGRWVLRLPVGGQLEAYHLASGRRVLLGSGRAAGWTADGRALVIVGARSYDLEYLK